MLNNVLRDRGILALILISHMTFEATPASPAHIHTHSHSSHSNKENTKERIEDGLGFLPRDRGHIVDGEHHSEFDHEAILGSVKDAEEFDTLSPEESKRRLKILLVKMDLNKDNFIDRNELRAWILRSFKMLSEEESNDRFEDADENNDGKVSWEEYKSDVYGSDEDLEHELNSEEQTLLKHDQVMFKAADKNNDGFLERHEFVPFSHPEESPEMLPLILQNTLEEKDTNKDGEIDFQEFVGSKGEMHDKQWLLSEKEKFDSEYDKDKDGKLGPNEILSWVVPSNSEIAEEEVEHLFASSDDDHDNLLSFEEVLKNHETFVGSEATDYGEHLHNIHHFEDEL
ncbi:reticulocalbin-2 [Cimex lectularius]|uniref:Reticulocalbin-3 n=1 Tax=Cimex lectularius TaxID=79782 RepID=A0A8I6S5R9_CIMLE|nr:reticulocalbin-2 [Cimex lectularius]